MTGSWMRPVQLRRLTRSGVSRFREYLSRLRKGAKGIDPPWSILTDPETSIPISGAPELDQAVGFSTKEDAANYLVDRLSGLDSNVTYGQDGVWSWLGLFFFQHLCPVWEEGRRRVREDDHYVFQPDDQPSDYRRLYRHLLYLPYHIVRTHMGQGGRSLMTGPVNTHGDMMEQIGSRQDIVSSRSIMEAVDLLYLVRADGQVGLKRGATNRNRGGTVRRFVSVIQQLDSTYDLHALTGDQIVRLLPPEFLYWVSDP